jgi:hypothetical protein
MVARYSSLDHTRQSNDQLCLAVELVGTIYCRKLKFIGIIYQRKVDSIN